MALDIVLTLLPIVLVFLLIAWKQVAVDISGGIGWLVTLLIALIFFDTPVEVGLRASLAGIISSFPISLMVVFSILQITFMESSGALRRVTVFLKTFGSSNQAAQIMLINAGAGTLLVAVGATPVSILPPIMVALGYSTFVAVALPAIGFDSLCTFAMLGAPLVVFSDLTGTPLVASAQVFAKFLPIVSTLVGFGMLWIVGGFKQVREGFVPCTIAGLTMGGAALAMAYTPHLNSGVVLTGVIAGLCTMLAMLLYLRLSGKPIIDRSKLTQADLAIENEMSLAGALSPWIILIVASLIINFYPPLFDYLYTELAMPVSVIPGQVIKTRMLWNAYTWVLISTIVSAIFIRPKGRAIRVALAKSVRRAVRPSFSTAIFFAIGFVMNCSGIHNVDGVWKIVDPNSNMVSVLGQGTAMVFGAFYPFLSAFIGLLGGFVTGTEASTIAMFTKYNILTSRMLHLDALVVTAATAVGSGLASVICPTKLQNAAATIDALGIESRVVRVAFVVSVVLTAVAAVVALVLAQSS